MKIDLHEPREKKSPSAPWLAFCRLALRLDESDARRLWKNLPVTLALVGAPNEKEREQLARHLEGAGISSLVRAEEVRGSACPTHRRLVAAEVCPACTERRACTLCLRAVVSGRCPSCAGRARFWTNFRRFRIAILLAILFLAGFSTWSSTRRVTSWKTPLTVGIYPIDTTGSASVSDWAGQLDAADFAPLGAFLQREAERNGIATRPVIAVRVGKPMPSSVKPPPPPDLETANLLSIPIWSLKLRWWAWRTQRQYKLPSATIRIFVLYNPADLDTPIEHSLGLAKVHIGVVHTHAGAADAGWTQVAIAHELLHTAGASDKYDGAGRPVFPDGYADPARSPRYPQSLAEIMAGQIPTSEAGFSQAASLSECRVGLKTAHEIGWLR